MGGHDRTRAVGGRLHAPKVRTGHRIDIERRASSALARRGHRAQSGHRRIGSVVFYLLLRTRQGLDFSGNCGYWTPRTSRRRARLWPTSACRAGLTICLLTPLDTQVYPTEMKYIFSLANATGGVNAACIASMPMEDRWKCNFAEAAYAPSSSSTWTR